MLKIIYQSIDMEKIEQINKNELLFIDLRSPKEYKEHTIPDAINLPVLTDESRKVVGRLYKKGLHDEAILKGVESISQDLPEIFEKILDLKRKYKSLILFCERGGFRSTSLFVLLKSLHINVEKLDGGYKAYRKYIVKKLDEEIEKRNFINLSGKTGVGKTEILNRIRDLDYSVLDLEALANHRGSLLGHIGMNEQPDQKMFESEIYNVLKSSKDLVFIEGESRRIGTLYIPAKLYEKMNLGIQILVEDSLENRVNRIYNEYVDDHDEEIFEALNSLSRYISKEQLEKYKMAIEKKDYEMVIRELCVKYYDKNYSIYKKDFDYILQNDENIIKRLIEIANI
ncbi:MAG: tRNA 2-selenouridine(34) synthase MnmH [Tissierellia bacterium]|nr:tRNA 2-selenouridine(34) synthase MnmH [Tissierellia bacterium]